MGAEDDLAAPACLWRRYQELRPAELVIHGETTEGARSVTVLRLLDDGSVEVFAQTDDQYAPENGWTRQRCDHLTASGDATDPGTDHIGNLRTGGCDAAGRLD